MKQKFFYLFGNCYVPYGIFVAVLFSTWMIQNALPLNHDVGWLLYSAEQYLDGAVLSKDIIEVNPPLIIYLYSITTLCARLVGLSSIFVLRIASILCFATVGYYCIRLLDKASSGQHRSLNRYFICCFLLPAAFFPLTVYGQREQLMILLFMPYLVSIIIKVMGVRLEPADALISAVLVAIAISLKPFFLIIVILLELYYVYTIKKVSVLIRFETMVIALVGFSYVAYVYVLNPEFFDFVLPFSIDIYWAIFDYTLADVLDPRHIAIMILPLLLFPVFRHSKIHKTLWLVLMLASLGAYIAYVQMQKPWPYHILPLIVLQCTLILFAIPLFVSRWAVDISSSAKENKKLAPGVGLVFGFMITMPVLVMVSIPQALGFVFSDLSHSPQRYQLFDQMWPNHIETEVQTLIEKHAQGGAFYSFTSSIRPTFPAVNHLQLTWSSRFPCHWLLPAIVREDKPSDDPDYLARLDELEQYVLDAVVEDLQRQPPQLIMVDTSDSKLHFSGFPIDYIEFFSRRAEFRAIWKNYEKVDYWQWSWDDKVYSYDFYTLREGHK